MTPLEQKLNQLTLSTMSRRVETTLTDAAARNLSVSATLEWLADMELDARQQRAIERRYRCSRLQAQPSIDAFQFNHHKTRQQARSRILRLLDLEFLATGTNLVLIGNPGVGKTFLAKIIAWRASQANQRVLFTAAMDMLNQLLASQVDHSLVRKLKTYTEPALLVCDELGYLALDQQTSNLFYQVISTRHTARNVQQLLLRTHPSPIGGTFCSTPPSRRPSPIGWWRTPRSSCWAARVCAIPRTPVRRPKKSCAGSTDAPRCDDNPVGGVRRLTPQRRCRGGREFPLPPLFPACSTSAPIISS
jgi:DNA replication protein DnaC